MRTTSVVLSQLIFLYQLRSVTGWCEMWSRFDVVLMAMPSGMDGEDSILQKSKMTNTKRRE
jgi:hypothetical protein